MRKTVLEMIKDRGFNVGNAELEESYETFAKRLEKSPNSLNIIAKKSFVTPAGIEMSEPIYVHFMQET